MAKAICVSKAHLLPILTLLSPDTVASLHFPCLSASLPQPHHPARPPSQSLSPLHHPDLGGASPYPSPTVGSDRWRLPLSGITTHLCGLWCLKVLLMVLPSMPASSSKVQGRGEIGREGSKGWSLEVGNGLTRYIDRIMGFSQHQGFTHERNSKGPIALPPKKKGGNSSCGIRR